MDQLLGREFRCRVESLEALRRLRSRYSGDFITGTGEWRLDAAPGGTRVVYEIEVVAIEPLPVPLDWLLSLGKIYSKFMREVLESLECETVRRVATKSWRGWRILFRTRHRCGDSGDARFR